MNACNARHRRIHRNCFAVAIGGAGLVASAAAQFPAGTHFSYQGRLNTAGEPANGTFDIEFKLFGHATLGTTAIATDSFDNVNVIDGVFTVQPDFGSNQFGLYERWIEIGVRPGASTGAYAAMTPRQELTAAPSAIWSQKPWVMTGNNLSYTTGRVGIGTNNPTSDLHVVGGQLLKGGPLVIDGPFGAGQSGNGQVIYSQTTGDALNCWNDGAGDAGVFTARTGDAVRGEVLSITGTSGNAVHGLNRNTDEGIGVLGEGKWGVAGFANAADGYGGIFTGMGGGLALMVIGTSRFSETAESRGGGDAEPSSGGFVVVGSPNGANIAIDNNEIMARNNGATSTLYLNNDGGIVRVPVLEITGADVAERFPCSEAAYPGTVMELDPDNAGKLRVAKGSYNKRVAGVVSGAGGLPAGAILGNLPGEEQNPAIAMSGRVWVKCDATGNAIQVGDMLTTSDTAGHAMKVADQSNAHGCVIGKAMTALAKGETGLVLVLVNLQ